MTCNGGHILEQEVFVHFNAFLFIERNRKFQCLLLSFDFSLLNSVSSEFESVVGFFLNGEGAADLSDVVFRLDHVVNEFVFGEDFKHFLLVFGELGVVENDTSSDRFLFFFLTFTFLLTARSSCLLLQTDV